MVQSGYIRDGLQNVLRSASQFINSIAIPGDSSRHVVVVTFVLRSRKTNVQFEIQELEGGVLHATGRLCLLGVGIGLGSIIIYKFFTSFFPRHRLRSPSEYPVDAANTSNSTAFDSSRNLQPGDALNKLFPETPDSGISADINDTITSNNFPSPKCHSSPTRCKRSYSDYVGTVSSLSSDDDESRPRRCRIENWLAQTTDMGGRHSEFLVSATEDELSDVCSGYPLDGGYPSCRSSGFLSAGRGTDCVSVDLRSSEDRVYRHGEEGWRDHSVESEPVGLSLGGGGCIRNGLDLDRALAGLEEFNFFDDPVKQQRKHSLGKRCLSAGNRGSFRLPLFDVQGNRRSKDARTFSFSSQTSGESSYTYRESLVSKGFSVDGGEDLGGMWTPPEFETVVVERGVGVEGSGMDMLHDELRQIQQDMDEMNKKLEGLQSREYYAITSWSPSSLSPGDRDHHAGGLDRSATWQDERNETFASFLQSDGAMETLPLETLSDLEEEFRPLGEEFMWDYHSDLAQELYDQSAFISCRPPVVDERWESVVGGSGEGLLEMGEDDLYIDDDITEMMEEDMSGQFEGIIERSDSTYELVSFTVPPQPRTRTSLDSVDSTVGSPSRRNSVASRRAGVERADVCRVCAARGLHLDDERRRHPSGSTSSDSRPPSGARRINSADKKRFTENVKDSPTTSNDQIIRNSSGSSSVSTTPRRLPCVMCSCTSTSSQASADAPQLMKTAEKSSLKRESVSSKGASSSSSLHGSPSSASSSCNNCGSRPGSSSTVSSLVIRELPARCLGWEVKNIGDKESVYEHLERHDVPAVVKKGYCKLMQLLNQSYVRPVRADLYCGLRAVLFQAMLQKLPILSGARTLDYCYQKLSLCLTSQYPCLNDWNFANRLPFSRTSVQMKLAECLNNLFQQVDAVNRISGYAEREQYLVSLFNQNPDTDLLLLEAVKVLMMLKAVSLYEEFTSGTSVSSFVWKLYSRETSRTVEQLFNNHVNSIGDTTRLDQVELCLLGHTLGVCIQVGRPGDCEDGADLISHCPGEGADGYPRVCIVDEDQLGRYCVMAAV